ncbi:MAG: hypothetical protein EZS28_012678 [Streblomastix strix]|uniref:HAT C-terminal dimerisation domain-containing protein n=1 Tax=Streblomastix strix TaxID=222440 RepID=A0A5J4WAW1_9EUKA|nr:MAG: hypothetical protein EZS28_012678 [Streblomastix strix]
MNQDDVFVTYRESYWLTQHIQSEEKQRLAEVALKLMSIPSSEAARERRSSTIKRLLGNDRSRLEEANLFAILLVQTQLTQKRQNRAKLIKDQRNENLMKQKSKQSHSSLIVTTIKRTVTKSQSQRAIKQQNKNDIKATQKKIQHKKVQEKIIRQ